VIVRLLAAPATIVHVANQLRFAVAIFDARGAELAEIIRIAIATTSRADRDEH